MLVLHLLLWQLPEGKVLNQVLAEINNEVIPVLEKEAYCSKRETDSNRQLEFHKVSIATEGDQDSEGAHGEPHSSVCCSEMVSQKGVCWAEA